MEAGEHIISISDSEFINISASGNGGAFVLENSQNKIFCCYFFQCQAQTHGGAMIVKNSINNISSIRFDSCFVREHDNEKYGNCFYFINSINDIKMNSVHKCGPDNVRCGDSPCVFLNKFVDLKNLNATNNFDAGGAGSISVFSPISGSSISYIHCEDVFSANYAELWNTNAIFSKCNFVNKTKNYMFWIAYSSVILTLEDCIFLNTLSKMVLGGGKLICNNCQSDVSYPGYNVTNISDKNKIIVRISYCKLQYCKSNIKNSQYVNQNTIYLYLLILI